MLLLDASVWAALAAPQERYHAASAALIESAQPFAALDLTLFEIANAVGLKMGKPERAGRLARLLVTCCSDRLVRVDPDLTDSALAIAAERGLTVYDAAYVAAARRNGWQLVSADLRDLVAPGLAVTPDAAV
jgi:predicted nucleic acid-binding protein